MKDMKQKLRCSVGVYLLILLIEECAEVIHRACKTIRFGLEEKQNTSSGKSEQTNQIRLEGELRDLLVVIGANQAEGNIQEDFESKLNTEREYGAKVTKIKTYMAYSRQCGTLSGHESI